MRKVEKLLDELRSVGFKGIKPLFLDEVGGWHEAYALFFLEFESNEPEISQQFEDYLNKKFKDCEIIVRGYEFEIIGPTFHIEEDAYYDDYLLIDELW